MATMATAVAMPFAAATFGLLKLLRYEWLLDKKVMDGLASLQADLKSMHIFLGEVTSLAPDLQVKFQVDEVSDLSHSIGMRVRSFVVRIESSKDAHIPQASKQIINHDIDDYIQARTIMLSSPLSGWGGIGKTTLAQAVHNKIKGDFDCGAFILIGQRAGPEKVLKDIFDGLHMEIYGKEPDQHQLADQLQDLLVHKRCLIVFDDIWDKETWDLIEYVCAGSSGSKVITTTRNRKFAEKCGAIYEIKPLCTKDSRKLLRAKAKAKSDDTEFDILLDKILHKCAGVPMAITVIGSFFAKKQRSDWNREYDSIGFDEHGEDSTFDVITKMMRYSYIDLPYHIRDCFLYLSLFPKDHWIDKNMLIWRWVAEGLVPDKLFESGDSYLNELIDRSMLQWAVSPRDVGQGGCRVHSLMFDLIHDMSSSQEQNFSTVLDMKKQESTSQTRPIHRLAIHGAQNQFSNSLNVGEVKSFYASRSSGSSFPPLQNFVELCVIDLEDCNLGDCKLEELGSKSLEYVGLLDTAVVELPNMIRRLKLLLTLDVTATGINKMPEFVEELVKLRCLRAGKGTCMMGRVGKLTSLEELWLYSADKSPDFAVGLQNLSQVRVLVIHFDEIQQSLQHALVDSLNELKKLQVLQIWSDSVEGKVCLDCWEVCVLSRELRQLLLFGVVLPRLTPWIHPSRVPKLSKLLVEVEVLEAHHLETLGEMPSLRSLYLHSEDNLLSYTASRDEFKVLEYLNTNIQLICGEGIVNAPPAPASELEVGKIMVGMDVGLRENMPLLKRATYHLDCRGCRSVEVEQAEEELRQASQAHPNRPALFIRRWNNIALAVEHHINNYVTEDMEIEFEALLNTGGSPAVLNMVSDILARFLPNIGVPHTLAVCGATDSTGSPSQLQRSVKRFEMEANNTWARVDELSAEIKASVADAALHRNCMKKWVQNPEFVACVNSANQPAGGTWSATDISSVVSLMLPEIVRCITEQTDGPGNDQATGAAPSFAENSGADANPPGAAI
ncbi:unnamed protein product [Alopecurus aequalis]